MRDLAGRGATMAVMMHVASLARKAATGLFLMGRAGGRVGSSVRVLRGTHTGFVLVLMGRWRN